MTHSVKEIRQQKEQGGGWTKFEKGGLAMQGILHKLGDQESSASMGAVHVRKILLDMLKSQM